MKWWTRNLQFNYHDTTLIFAAILSIKHCYVGFMIMEKLIKSFPLKLTTRFFVFKESGVGSMFVRINRYMQ